MSHPFRTLGAAVTATTAALALAGPASADPRGESIPIVCDDGTTTDVITSGNGTFTPGHETGSTRTLVVTSFGDFHGVVTNADTGEVIEEFTDAADFKGRSSKAPRDYVTCTFSFSGDEFDEESGTTIHFEGGGTVTGFLTPAR